MIVLGLETSCDECAAAVVDGGLIRSNVVASQIPVHTPWQGVVPEIASRTHTEWIDGVVKSALTEAGLSPSGIEGVAVTSRPGLLGSLLVGLHFAKAFAWARDIPFIAVDHMLAHLYASRLVYKEGGPVSTPLPADSNGSLPAPLRPSPHQPGWSAVSAYPPVSYPFLGLLVSGGHTIICRADNFDDITVLGTTIDDAVGEAFDKVAKFYGFGYPGGAVIDRLAQKGNDQAFAFPLPNLYKVDKEGRDHRYDVSYSGLKTAVVNQLEQFRRPPVQGRVPVQSGAPVQDEAPAQSPEAAAEDIAASFQKTAVDILIRPLLRAAEDTGLTTIVAGGGAAANSLLRSRLAEHKELRVIFPPPELCGDNAAMVAGLGEQYLLRGDRSPLNTTASARVGAFRKRYPA